MFGDVSREEEEKAMANLIDLVSLADRRPAPEDSGLDAATLAFIYETGGVVAS
jgi:hypothetical protein